MGDGEVSGRGVGRLRGFRVVLDTGWCRVAGRGAGWPRWMQETGFRGRGPGAGSGVLRGGGKGGGTTCSGTLRRSPEGHQPFPFCLPTGAESHAQRHLLLFHPQAPSSSWNPPSSSTTRATSPPSRKVSAWKPSWLTAVDLLQPEPGPEERLRPEQHVVRPGFRPRAPRPGEGYDARAPAPTWARRFQLLLIAEHFVVHGAAPAPAALAGSTAWWPSGSARAASTASRFVARRPGSAPSTGAPWTVAPLPALPTAPSGPGS